MKIPKSMGACADLLHDTREKRLALQKQVDALKGEEAQITDHIINNLDKNSTGAAGKRYRVQVVTKAKLRINPEKWNNFFGWVAKNNAWDTLGKRVNEKALEERMNQKRPPKVPGLEQFHAVSVSLTKV